MTTYRYIKSSPVPKTNGPVSRPIHISRVLQKRISFLVILLGIVLFGSAAYPIVSYELFTSPQFQPIELVTPASARSSVLSANATGLSQDLTHVGDWFPSAPSIQTGVSKINSYNLSIPKLKILGATVKIGGEDLGKSLIHYGGTGLPGQPGNAVVIGHSVLPQFFDPKNYLTIFSTLPTLRSGDEIFISYDGIQYRYVVEDMVEVEPTNFSVLEQRFDDSFITLITCVPPGLKTRRLAVRGRLVNNIHPI